jgi:hypothetical protein
VGGLEIGGAGCETIETAWLSRQDGRLSRQDDRLWPRKRVPLKTTPLQLVELVKEYTAISKRVHAG